MIPSRILLAPLSMGSLMLPNRLVVKSRGNRQTLDPIRLAEASATEYSPVGAAAGLVVLEAIPVPAIAAGADDFSEFAPLRQQRAWKEFASLVHRTGGRIFALLTCNGPDNGAELTRTHTGAERQGASLKHHLEACAAGVKRSGQTAVCTLNKREIHQIAARFAQAARQALAAGLDGVEIDASNGSLLEQFCCTNLNVRGDEYGGSLRSRCRLIVATALAVSAAIGRSRTGLRLSLDAAGSNHGDLTPGATFSYLATELNRIGLTYLHLNDTDGRPLDHAVTRTLAHLRGHFSQSIVLSGHFNVLVAESLLHCGYADLIGVGDSRAFGTDRSIPAFNLPLCRSETMSAPSRGLYHA